MLERLGTDARKVVERAEAHARSLGVPSVTTAHLLLALVEAAGTGELLLRAGVRLADARAALVASAGDAPGAGPGRLPLDSGLRSVLRTASRRSLASGAHELAPIHLLEALTVERPDGAMTLLAGLGVNVDGLAGDLGTAAPPPRSRRRRAAVRAALFQAAPAEEDDDDREDVPVYIGADDDDVPEPVVMSTQPAADLAAPELSAPESPAVESPAVESPAPEPPLAEPRNIARLRATVDGHPSVTPAAATSSLAAARRRIPLGVSQNDDPAVLTCPRCGSDLDVYSGRIEIGGRSFEGLSCPSCHSLLAAWPA